MNPADDNDLNRAAADAAIALLQRHAPEGAEIAAPYVHKLFAALADGHAFIRISAAEAAVLAQAEDVAGRQGTPLVLHGKRLFLGRIWQLEQDLAAEIMRLAGARPEAADWLQAAHNLAQWFGQAGSEGQRDAAALALFKPFMLISGGPGTGKTTTVAKLLGLLCDNPQRLPRIALAAPTGKAAAHMARALHRALDGFNLPEAARGHLLKLEGRTVHRLLKLRPPQMQPAFNREQPLPLDVLVVDEASMLDTALLLQLLRAVPTGCRVVLLGDENQLPPVEAGAVLAGLAQPTLLGAETARQLETVLPQHGFEVAENPPVLSENTARLQFSHRFGSNSGIGCLARAVVRGDAAAAWAQFAAFSNELELREAHTAGQAEALYRRQADYWRAVDSGSAEAAFKYQTDAVVLAARREDAAGFNEAYRRCLQRNGRAGAAAPWFAGQMIMVTRNDYAQELFNGDIGLILPDGENPGILAAYFETAGGLRKTALGRLPAHETAFAVTVHKSQGSEYREVWLLPPAGQGAEARQGMSRALLYTAVTRARKRFVFWGGRSVFEAACNAGEPRRSALREMLVEAAEAGSKAAEAV